MLIEQIIEFELRGWAPWPYHVLLQLVIFITKQKIFKKYLLGQVLFTAEIFQEAMYVTSPYLDQITFKI